MAVWEKHLPNSHIYYNQLITTNQPHGYDLISDDLSISTW